ncbi:MAG TPA: OmpA family protein [Allosphingosinicella sp.]|nr:OmpA family protein [Allosphingosinicella sp.]
MNARNRSLALFAAAAALATPALAEDAKRIGVIMSMSEGQLNLRTREGPLTVVMTPSTEIKEDRGLNNIDRATDSLMTGLIIKVEGDLQGNTITADEIEFKQRDWRAAVATKAGTAETFEQQNARLEQAAAERAELRQAIIDGNEYVIREETTVYFTTGSAAIAPQYKEQLRAIASKAASHGNYRVSILGFADPRGNAQANERLSLKRAMAVSTYLRTSGHIQPGRVLSPSAMGEGTAAPMETMPTSDDQARRVVVRILTPKTQLK